MVLEIVASNMREKTHEERENKRYGIIEQTHTDTQYIAGRDCVRRTKKRA